MEDVKLKQYREMINKRIKELEAIGGDAFYEDVEDDPTSVVLNPEDVDYLYGKPINKIKNKIACWIGNRMRANARKTYNIKLVGTQNLDYFKENKTGAIICGNHFAHFESACATFIMREINKKGRLFIVIKEGNYQMKGMFGFLFKYCDTLPLSSNPHTMKNFSLSLSKVLNNNNFCLVYPEQAMWYNYEKPRPPRQGAFRFAVKNNVPVIPYFVTFSDSSVLDKDGSFVKNYTVHIFPPLFTNPDLTLKENIKFMADKYYQLCCDKYEEVYKKKVKYGD